MNFQTVRDAEGQMDGQYQRKVAMFGTPQTVEDVAFTPQGKKFQQATITDDLQEVQKVKIWGGKMDVGCVGQRLSFEIAPYTSERNNQVYYSGFWKDKATIGQAPQQSQKPTPKQEQLSVDTSCGKVSIERQTAWLGACQYAAKKDINNYALIKIAQAGEHFIRTGKNLYEEQKAADDRKESYVDEPIREPGEDA